MEPCEVTQPTVRKFISLLASLAGVNKPPQIVITCEPFGYVGVPFLVDFAGTQDPDGRIIRFQINWGDDSFLTIVDAGGSTKVFHEYDNPGRMQIEVFALDNSGFIVSQSVNVFILQQDVAPFVVEDQSYVKQSNTGQPIPVFFDAPIVTTGGTPPISEPVYEIESGSLFPIGTTEVPFYVLDALNRQADGIAFVTVEDTKPPAELVITPPPDQTVTSLDGNPVPVSWPSSAAVGGKPPYIFTYEENNVIVSPGQNFSIGKHTINAVVEDSLHAEDSQPFTINVVYNPPVPSGDNQAYFDARVARPDCIFNYALTSDAQIQQYMRSAPNQYSPFYDAPMNAMRITMPPGTQGSISNQIWLPCFDPGPAKLIFIWEDMEGPEWVKESNFTGWKFYQIRKDGDKIWFEIQSSPLTSPQNWLKSRIRQYSSVGPFTTMGNYEVSDEFGKHKYNSDSVRSTVNPPRNWATSRNSQNGGGIPGRYMVVADQVGPDPNNPDPVYVRFSFYASDPNHPIIEVHKDIYLTIADNNGVAGAGRARHFDFEINSSQPRTSPGPEAYMWARFLTVHKNVQDHLSLFQQITGW